MIETLRCFAPAKINLFLHILGRNPNGMHALQTIFQLVDFGDTLTFTLLDKPNIELQAPNCTFPTEENLVFRAAKLLQETYQVKQGVRIQLDKKIPSGAGLGGGSSDAGATLRMLNQLWQLNLSQETLMAHGKTLGADVPVFVLNQHAWAEGIGELLTPITLPKQAYVIIKPDCHINTRDFFAHPNLPRNTPALKVEDICLEKIYSTTKNDFEALAFLLYPEVAAALEWLRQFGHARLTGSGSCLFMPVASKHRGNQIAKLAPKTWEIIVCESL